MPKAFWISTYHAIHDQQKFEAYLKLAGPAIEAAGGKFLARGRAAKAYEAGLLERSTLIEFESLDAAIAVHDGPEYQAALKALDGAVTRDLRLIEAAE